MFFRFLFILLPLVFLNVSYAADEGDWWLQRQIQIGDGKNQYAKKVYGKAARTVMESVPIDNGTSEEFRQLMKRSIAVDVPTATKVGTPMLKRITHVAKTPGAQLIGTLAVMELIEAIGWVMEDGIYVKRIPEENCDSDNLNAPECNPPYLYDAAFNTTYAKDKPSPSSACNYLMNDESAKETFSSVSTKPRGMNNDVVLWECVFTLKQGGDYSTPVYSKENPNFKPDQPQKDKVVPLTAPLLGAAMLGTGYKDPDPKFDNSRINKGNYTGVADVYEHDPTGIGNERADDMDDKLKNAPPTTDGKPSYIGDPKYDDKPLTENDDSADRSWNEDGDTATGDTKPDVDPDGNPTGGSSISLQFPLFCSWASKMCEWYDDWKSSDKVYKEHMTEEKSFWDKVKEWFDWSKNEDGLPDRDDSELIVEPQFEEKKVAINWSAECPAPKYEMVSLHGYTAQVKVQDFSFLCSLDWLIKPFTIGFASILSIFIIFGFQRGTE